VDDERARQITGLISVLHTWGIHSLGQLAALDKQELAVRLGPLAAELWERASGRHTRPLRRVKPPEIFEEVFEFEHEIETTEPLLFMLRRFLESFAVRLGANYLVAKELTLRITFSDKKNYERVFKIPQPTNDVELLFRTLQTHLENFTSDAPIVAVSLRAQPAKPAQQQFGLFETALRNPAQLAETLARLAALVGNDRVGTPVLANTHRPDTFHIEPFRWELPEQAEAPPPLPRVALRRLRPSPTASVFLDNNRPAHLRSDKIDGAIVAQNGPYRSSGNWWDEKIWSRAEWDVQLENGALCRCHAEANAWQIDGIYD
jgi:protein ImuB